MGITVSCTVCRRQFNDIDPAMIGQKARCSCGTVVLLVAPTEKPQPIPEPAPIVVAPVETPSIQPPPVPVAPVPQPASRKKVKQKPRRQKSKPKKVVAPIVVSDSSAATPQEIPVAPISVVKPRSKSKAKTSPKPPEEPIVGDSFADMDDVLSGGIDSSPIQVKPQPPQRKPNRPTSAAPVAAAEPEATDSSTEDSIVGIAAAVFAGGAAIFLGVLLLLPQITSLEGSVMGWFGEPLYGLYQLVYGESPVEGPYRVPMQIMGWLLTLVAPVSIVLGLATLLHGGLRAAGTSFASWSTRAGTILGVVMLFSLMAVLLITYTHHDLVTGKLNELVPQLADAQAEVQVPENVRVAQEQYATAKQRFSFAMMILAIFSTTVFIGSIISVIGEGKPKAAV